MALFDQKIATASRNNETQIIKKNTVKLYIKQTVLRFFSQETYN